MKAFNPVVLASEHVRLEPLGPAHIPGLVAAAAEDRTTYNWTPVPEDAAQIREWVERAENERLEARIAALEAQLARPGTV